jgi:hypothetical protein
MPIKNPDQVTTHQREEMVCPLCFTDGLEPHPGYAPEYDGPTAIVRGTRCPNESCRYHDEGVPPEQVTEQFSEQGILAKLAANIDRSTVLAAALVLGSIAFLAVNVLGIDIPGTGQPADATVNGQVTTEDGTPVQDVTVTTETTATTVKTGADGQYQLQNVTPGTRTLLIEPSGQQLAAMAVPLEVSSDGLSATATTRATVDGQRVDVTLTPLTTASTTGTVQDEAVVVEYANPANSDTNGGVDVTLSPLGKEQGSGEKTVDTTGQSTVTVPGPITTEKLVIEGLVNKTQTTQTRSWTGGGQQQLALDGNQPPANVSVDIYNISGDRGRSISKSVGDGTTFTQQFNGTVKDDATLTIGGGSATGTTTQTGTYTGQNPTISVDEADAPAKVRLELTGAPRTNTTTSSGAIADGTAEFEIAGSLAARNVTLTFTGGTPTNARVGAVDTAVDAADGEETARPVVFEAPTTGEYRLTTTFDETRNGDLVEAGYERNGERTTVSAGQSQQTLELNESDTVRAWLQATQERIGTEKSYDRGGHEVYVTDTTVSSTQVATGERLTVTATMENQGGAYGLDVLLFEDGTTAETNNEYFSGGESKQVSFTTRFAESGTHTVSVNEGAPVSVQVGDGAPRSGAGELNITASKLGEDGSVAVDVDADGTTDQTVRATGGTVTLDESPPGPRSVAVSQQGVTDTGFTVDYEARYGAKQLSADIDDDGTADINNTGVLTAGETLTETTRLDAGSHPVRIGLGNNGSVRYTLTVSEAGQVIAPTIYANGEPLVNETGSFTGERTYAVSSLSAGTTQFRVESQNASNRFTLGLDWTETRDTVYPGLTVDGERVCAPQAFASSTCTFTPSETTVSHQFEAGASPFDYRLSYTSRTVPRRVALTVGEETTQYQRPSSAPRTGSWTRAGAPRGLTRGSNTVALTAPPVDGVQPSATATLSYTYDVLEPDSPTVVVTNADGERFEQPVADKALTPSGRLTKQTQLSLPADWFERGANQIQVRSRNNGVVNVSVTTATGTGGSVTLASDG